MNKTNLAVNYDFENIENICKMNLKKRNHPLKNGFFVMIHYVFLLSGFGLHTVG